MINISPNLSPSEKNELSRHIMCENIKHKQNYGSVFLSLLSLGKIDILEMF